MTLGTEIGETSYNMLTIYPIQSRDPPCLAPKRKFAGSSLRWILKRVDLVAI